MKKYQLGITIGGAELVEPNKNLVGKCSIFGGPADFGVTEKEGLALLEYGDAHDPKFAGLFGPLRLGLARSLNPSALYCAMRWDYTVTPRKMLRENATVEIHANGKVCFCRPVDWGPNVRTGRIIDLSPGAAFQLGVKTDDVVIVKLITGRPFVLSP